MIEVRFRPKTDLRNSNQRFRVTVRYVEAKGDETWLEANALLVAWIKDNASIEGAFGWSEGDSLKVGGELRLLGFNVPDRHGAKVKIVDQWARTSGRLLGVSDGKRVSFEGRPDLSVIVPSPQSVPTPPWSR
jgi:hypothetical protein